MQSGEILFGQIRLEALIGQLGRNAELKILESGSMMEKREGTEDKDRGMGRWC